jgi:hypothetical protein
MLMVAGAAMLGEQYRSRSYRSPYVTVLL